jgi:hypothetical protein
MNMQKLIATLFLVLPGLSWGGPPPPVPVAEPGMLALLGAGGGAVVALIALIRGRK